MKGQNPKKIPEIEDNQLKTTPDDLTAGCTDNNHLETKHSKEKQFKKKVVLKPFYKNDNPKLKSAKTQNIKKKQAVNETSVK